MSVLFCVKEETYLYYDIAESGDSHRRCWLKSCTCWSMGWQKSKTEKRVELALKILKGDSGKHRVKTGYEMRPVVSLWVRE